MEKPSQCNVQGCSAIAVAELEQSPYCRPHLFEVCYERIDHYRHCLHSRSLGDSDEVVVRNFVAEGTRLLTDMANTTPQLDNLERARVLDLLLRIAELGQQLRRSPRRAARVPVRLVFNKPGQAWEEDTQTQIISRSGAKLACHHALDSGALLFITRLDTRQSAQARVAWCHRIGAEACEIGIELLGCDNFWNIDWGEIETAPAAPSTTPQHSR